MSKLTLRIMDDAKALGYKVYYFDGETASKITEQGKCVLTEMYDKLVADGFDIDKLGFKKVVRK